MGVTIPGVDKSPIGIPGDMERKPTVTPMEEEGDNYLREAAHSKSQS